MHRVYGWSDRAPSPSSRSLSSDTGYTAMFQILSAIIAATGFAALLVSLPEVLPPVPTRMAESGDVTG